MSNQPKTFYARVLERKSQSDFLAPYLYIQIRQSRAFIEQYHADKINVGQMAAAAFMSRFYYIKIFKQIYGITPRQHLRDLRIRKAKALLEQELTVTQVCLAVGYESLPTFSAAFKRGTGLSPKAYQKLNRGDSTLNRGDSTLNRVDSKLNHGNLE